MIPFFALIGLVTVISIIVNLQINRHSLFNKIIGTVILTFACIFSCFAILYPLYFGSYENLIITFVAAFILLIGIYAVSGLVVNRRRLKNVVYVSAEGSDVTSDYGKAKELIKPVQLKPSQAPKTKRRGQASQNDRKVPVVKREKQLDQYGLNESAATEKERATRFGIIQPDRPSFDGDVNRAMPRMTMMKDLGMQLETGTIEEAIVIEAEQIDVSVSFKDIDAEPQVQTEITAMDSEQTISVEPTTEEDIEPQIEPEDIELDNEEIVSFETATDEYAELQVEPEDSDMDAELLVGYESAAEEDEKDAELLADTETSDIDTEQVGYAGEEDVEPQAEPKDSDLNAELMVGFESATEEYEENAELQADTETSGIENERVEYTVEEDVEPQTEPEESDMGAELLVGYESAAEEDEKDAELQADTEASDIDTEQMVGYAAEEAVEPQAQTGDSDMGAEQMVGLESAAEGYVELQAVTETSDINTEQVGYAGEEDVEPQAEPKDSDLNAEQMVGFESATEEYEENAELQAVTETSDIDTEQAGYVAEEDVEPQAQTGDSDMGAEQVVSVLTVEDKYSRLITKALELKNQRQYLNAIFLLQSVYDGMDETLRKQADMQLMECFILSGQFHEGQKKWFDILNKKYDFEPDEKAKLKSMMVQLNARQL